MGRLAICLLTIFSVCGVGPGGHAAGQTGAAAALDQRSEITLERIREVCLDCSDHRVILSRGGGDKFGDAAVTYVDLRTKKQRQGRLPAYYFNNLLRLIESQGFFEMKDEYAMGWEDSTIVNLSVISGDRRKLIRTRNEGEVPMQLWGLYMAIDGVVANAIWKGGR